MALHVCVACHRHIRRNACDFCGHLNDFAPAPVRSFTLGAGTRAALVLGSALALGACDSDTSDPTPPGLDAAYGGPPIEDATPPGLDAAYGGRLRLWVTPQVDLAPLHGRLVVFRSTLVEHEVLPVFSPRYAATAWYYGPPSGA